MPFLTEEIWQKLPGHGEALVVAEWPVPQDQYFDAPGAAVVEEWMELIRRVRNVRSEMNVPPGKPVPVLVRPADQEALRDFEGERSICDGWRGLIRSTSICTRSRLRSR